jgi:putative membrane protein insertion efficiency factor
MSAEPGSPELPCRSLSVGQQLALTMLTAYKVLLSPLFTGSCRFLPSCSDYAREAITVHGCIKGMWLAARRLSRCQPLGSSGLDPVPARAARMSSTRM